MDLQQWTDQPIFDVQGRLVEFQSVGRDITKRKQAEQALQQHAERLKILNEIGRDILAARTPAEIAQAGQTRLAALSRQLIEAQETERRRLARELHSKNCSYRLAAIGYRLFSEEQAY